MNINEVTYDALNQLKLNVLTNISHFTIKAQQGSVAIKPLLPIKLS